MIVEIAIEPTYPQLPSSGNSQFRIFNGRNCVFNIGIGNGVPNFELNPGKFHFANIPVTGNSATFTIAATTSTAGCSGFNQIQTLESGKANSFFLTNSGSNTIIRPYEDDPDKSRQGRPLLRVLTNFGQNVTLEDKDGKLEIPSSDVSLDNVPASNYEVLVEGISAYKNLDLKVGGVYTLIVIETTARSYVRKFCLTFKINLRRII
jgi:hypothetical protein